MFIFLNYNISQAGNGPGPPNGPLGKVVRFRFHVKFLFAPSVRPHSWELQVSEGSATTWKAKVTVAPDASV